MRRPGLIICLILIASTLAWAQNPMIKNTADEPTIYLQRVPGFIMVWSRSLQEKIAEFSRLMGGDGGILYGVAAFLSAVAFGIIHVAGPGHGKVFTITYFSSKKSTFREGIILSGLINIIDSLSAGILILVGYGVLSVVFSEFRENAVYFMQLASYGLVTIFGILHLIHHVRHSGHDHGHETRRPLPPWLLALSIGLVPCPVSTLILVFGLANGMLGFSIILVGGVSLGGFITMTALSLAIIGGKKGLVAKVEGPRATKVLSILEYVSSFFIVAAGAVLLLATL